MLGQRYREKGEEFERVKDFASASTNYVVAGECFAKAEEIATSDMMVDHGVTRAKKGYCQRKAKETQEKSREQLAAAPCLSRK